MVSRKPPSSVIGARCDSLVQSESSKFVSRKNYLPVLIFCHGAPVVQWSEEVEFPSDTGSHNRNLQTAAAMIPNELQLAKNDDSTLN